MPYINISDETHKRLAQRSRTGRVYDRRSVQYDDGSWDIWIGEDTLMALEEKARPGESMDDVVRRILE